jgi:branched-chain amino acid transport system permease protein
MTATWKKTLLRWDVVALTALFLYPLLCALARSLFPGVLGPSFGNALGDQMGKLLIYAVLALGLNVAVGYTGLLQLGIAAFFAIGVYITGILTVPVYPFQIGFGWALVISTLGTALCGLILGAPTLRLRGDYLAIVTLGFGEMVKVMLLNLEGITAGSQALNPIPPPQIPDWLSQAFTSIGMPLQAGLDYRPLYYISLFILAMVVLFLRNLETSRMGRAWIAIREDELAAACMGINVTRAKMASFAVSAGLAGMAGCLYATNLTNTGEPNLYGFNRSIIMLCCVILGGLGSIRGTLLGVMLLLGFDDVLSPKLDTWIQSAGSISEVFAYKNWRLMIFGLTLILMMRFRPEGLLPSSHVQHELHTDEKNAPA